MSRKAQTGLRMYSSYIGPWGSGSCSQLGVGWTGSSAGGSCIPEQEGRGVHDDVAGEGEGLSSDKDTYGEVEGPGGVGHIWVGAGSLHRGPSPRPPAP